MSLQLKVTSNEQASYLPLDEITMIYTTQPGAVYTLIDDNGKAVTEGLELKQSGDRLELIYQGNAVAVLDEFYAANDELALYAANGVEFSATENADLTSEGTLVVGTMSEPESGVVWNAENSSLDANTANDSVSLANSNYELQANDTNLDMNEDHSSNHNFLISTLGVVGAVGIAGLASGGSSSSSDDKVVTTTESISVNVSAAAGQFTSVVDVTIYDLNGNILTSEAVDMSEGGVSLSIGTQYSGPILVVVEDANEDEVDYVDETTNELVSLGEAPLRAMAIIDGDTVDVSVTPLTELAVREADIYVDDTHFELTTSKVAINDQIGEFFGIYDITGSLVTVLDDNYEEGTNQEQLYGQVLAMFSGIDHDSGSISSSLDQLAESITVTESGEIEINDAGFDLLNVGAETFTDITSTDIDLTNLIDTLGIESSDGTDIVVFDLETGESSDHSDQTFDSETAYTIYIVADNYSETFTLDESEMWNSGENLGDDDKIFLIGESITSLGHNTSDGISLMAWRISLFSVHLFNNGELQNGVSSVELWSGSNSASIANQGNLLSLPTSVAV